MSKTKECRTCGVMNEPSAYACASCGVSLRLSPPMRPAPALSPPIVAPKLSATNDTLDIETELPDEELDQLLAHHTPPPSGAVMDELATFDEATDGLAPSVSFEDLEVLSPGTNRPPLQLRKEPSLQDSIGIDPLSEFPQKTQVLNRLEKRRPYALWLVLVSAVVGGAWGIQVMRADQSSEVIPLPEQGASSPSASERLSSVRYGLMSVRPQLRRLTSEEVGLDPVVLRAHSKVWSRVSEAGVSRAQESGGALDLVAARLGAAEASLFEAELTALSGGDVPPPLSGTMSGALQELEQQLAQPSTSAPSSTEEATLRRDLKIWLYALQGRFAEAGALSVKASVAPARSSYSWARVIPLISSGSVQDEDLDQLAIGESCARELYLLRAYELALGDEALPGQYRRFADCLTQLMAQDHLSAAPVFSEQASAKVSAKRKRKRASTEDPIKLSGGYQAMMTQGGRALERGRVKQAEVYFKRASSLSPKSPDPVAQLGWCDLARGRARSSLKHFKTALSFKSDHADSLYGLGYAYDKLGSWDTARGHFTRYLKLYPRGAKVRIIENKLSKMPK